MGSSDQKREMPSLTSSGPSTWYPTASSGRTPGKLSASRGSEALPKKRCLELSGARTPAFIEAAEFQTPFFGPEAVFPGRCLQRTAVRLQTRPIHSRLRFGRLARNGHRLSKNFWIFRDFRDTVFPRRANKYIGTARRPGPIPERRHLMHSATSVVRAIRPGANRAERPTEEPRSLPDVRCRSEKRISIYGEPAPGAAVTRFGDGPGAPGLPPFADGHRPPLVRFGDGGPPAKQPSLALQA